jgi:hypothetical protein
VVSFIDVAGINIKVQKHLTGTAAMELRPPFFLSIDEPSGAKIDVAASFGARSHNGSSYVSMFSVITIRFVFVLECPSILRGCEPLSATLVHL